MRHLQQHPYFRLEATLNRTGSSGNWSCCALILDVSCPQVALSFIADYPADNPRPIWVIGSTGWNQDALAQLRQLSLKAQVLWAPNFSLSVAWLRRIIRQSRPTLQSWGYRARLTETHHAAKRDAPSGTALEIAAAWEGASGSLIPICVIREGDSFARHEFTLSGPLDELCFTHQTLNLDLYARDALQLSEWCLERSDQHPQAAWWQVEDFLERPS